MAKRKGPRLRVTAVHGYYWKEWKTYDGQVLFVSCGSKIPLRVQCWHGHETRTLALACAHRMAAKIEMAERE